jgi:hypothetical protein
MTAFTALAFNPALHRMKAAVSFLPVLFNYFSELNWRERGS